MQAGDLENVQLSGARLGDNVADLGLEAHAEHAVRLIEHEQRDRRQARRLARHKVEQAAGRGGENIDAVSQRARLRGLWRATIHARVRKAKRAAHGVHRRVDLRRKLARGR